MQLRQSQAPLDSIDVVLSGLDAGRRFLLKHVQHGDRRRELDRIDGPVSVAVVVLHNFEDGPSPNPLSGSAESCFLPKVAKSIANPKADRTSDGILRRSFSEEETHSRGFRYSPVAIC
jgi:hypothetical protein